MSETFETYEKDSEQYFKILVPDELYAGLAKQAKEQGLAVDDLVERNLTAVLKKHNLL